MTERTVADWDPEGIHLDREAEDNLVFGAGIHRCLGEPLAMLDLRVALEELLSRSITLLDPRETDAEGDTRGFSISSAPREDGTTITTRLRDTAFKRVLQQVPPGTRVKIEGPFGDLRLHHAARPAVLVAGGIGITPFRSILVETIGDGRLPYRVLLFHANRRPEDAAFADEFRALERTDPNLTFVPTMTAMAASTRAWRGEQGALTRRCSSDTLQWSFIRSITSLAPRAWSRACERCLSHPGWMRTTSGPRNSQVTESHRSHDDQRRRCGGAAIGV